MAILKERAPNEECKRTLLEVACMKDNLYPKEIESTCDFYEKVNYLGCFRDSLKQRLLNGARIRFEDYNNPYECTKFCASQNFALAGVQFGIGCDCGNNVSEDKRLPEHMCNMSCPGDQKYKCGGHLAMNVYEVSSNT